MSSPGADDVCPICLCPIDEEFSRPENCQHRFDSDCLKEWSKLRLSCPSCRATFGAVYTYKILEGKPTLHKVQKMEEPAEAEPFDETNPLDFTVCEICSGGMHEELLLICDQCDKGFHTYCLTPPLDGVPTTEQWFCPQCEESRVNRPSTSRTAEPSARAIRLVQRTALAERVRRRLARNRRIVETSRSGTEEEESDGIDEEEEEEEEEEGEEEEEEGAEEEEAEEEGEEEDEEDEEGENSAASSEEEVKDFFDDDFRVLSEIGQDVLYKATPLPSIKRRSKKQPKKKTKSKKKKVSKRRTKGKRKIKRVHSKRTSTKAAGKEGPMDAFVVRRGGARDPIARLSLLGAGLEPIADEDPLVTENSRRFDRPIVRRKEESSTPKEEAEEKNPVVDACDLLGAIIPEQTKTLAPGRLFAVRGGRFNTTEDFEKYKARTTNHMSSELKERLGIPVEKSTSEEEPSKRKVAAETREVKNDIDKVERHTPNDHPEPPSLFKKPELEHSTRYRESCRKEANGASHVRQDDKSVEGRYQPSSRERNQQFKRSTDERASSSYRRNEKDRARVAQGCKPEERYRPHHQMSNQSVSKNCNEKLSAAKGGHDVDRDHATYMRLMNIGRSSHLMSNQRDMVVPNEIRSATRNHGHIENSRPVLPDERAVVSSTERPHGIEKQRSNEKVSAGFYNHKNKVDQVLQSSKNIEERHASSASKSSPPEQNLDGKGPVPSRYERHSRYDDETQRHDRNGSEAKSNDNDKKRYLTDRKYHPNHLPHTCESITNTNTNSERRLRFEESEREDRGLDVKPLMEKKPNEDRPGGATNDWMPNLQTTAHSTAGDDGAAESEVKDGKTKGDELLSTIEGFAKEGIKHYKKRLTRDEYKDVMRAVVRECYKKRILDETKVKEKVKKYVHAVKNGETLPYGHHSAKRKEGPNGNEAPASLKRPRVESW